MRHGYLRTDFQQGMIVFPQAKVNLGLNVVRKRPDGYHDIESVLVPIPLCDALEAIADKSVGPGGLRFGRSGVPLAGDARNDLVVRAHALVAERRSLPGLRMHLHKRIPAGAGLGGGSSDGTNALLLMDKLLGLALTGEEMLEMATALGSDCPFFLNNRAQLAMGRGELLTPVSVEFRRHWIYLVNPGIHVPTGEAFSMITPTGKSAHLDEAIQNRPMSEWRSSAPNTMEEVVSRKHPEIAFAIDRLLRAGAMHAAMSGSGSTVFGIFGNRPALLEWPVNFSAWVLSLGE
ncbi:MAG: 4-(cytidine 5'-diphospho)-2-C-methyl-D-erythritol kinase [Flavobacteriales bacterium]|nr:4-(cytidine 5'-diphospho)-2-C-methyl-D-erythritol kinase [Flavobacteriales bacterium]